MFSPKRPKRSAPTSAADQYSRPSTYRDAGTQYSGIPTTTFTSFPNLPLELRSRVWEFALPGPRLLALDFFGDPPRFTCLSAFSPPNILQVCQESRKVALRKCPLFFVDNAALYPPYLFYNSELDTVAFLHNDECMADLLSSCEAAKIKRMIIWLDGLYDVETHTINENHNCLFNIRHAKNLKEIVFFT
jgi:hypothetical protein